MVALQVTLRGRWPRAKRLSTRSRHSHSAIKFIDLQTPSFHQITNCCFLNSFLFIIICVAPCFFAVTTPRLNAFLVSPLFVALPYVSVLSLLSTVFAHSDPGGRGPLFFCEPPFTSHTPPVAALYRGCHNSFCTPRVWRLAVAKSPHRHSPLANRDSSWG
jgi:hypothetical protein